MRTNLAIFLGNLAAVVALVVALSVANSPKPKVNDPRSKEFLGRWSWADPGIEGGVVFYADGSMKTYPGKSYPLRWKIEDSKLLIGSRDTDYSIQGSRLILYDAAFERVRE